ncbi:serine/threonine-protein kinase [Streptomyces sp. NPDC089919]|uniref:serine/threonine-protein kinase n=1 Tax=Streptomyces sp. NPDC089919 TaxID=3155188 RepID=UPI00343045E8
MDAVAGQLVADRYRLDRLLGSGGFGRVWAAEDTVLGVRVAVKELRLGHVPPEERPELLVRAAREARHAARLRDHPHIVTVYDVLEVDAAAWIVMRLVAGQSLAELLRAEGALSESRTRAIARAVLDALRFVHGAGITHRDVKPANIMVTPDGDVLLTDFGIAVDRADTRLTRTGLVAGTPGYTAPERWLGAEPSGASDLYSLGVTLYQSVEGRLPFPPEDPVAALTGTPPPARRAGALAPLITSLLAGDPARRPTPAEAIALLDEHRDAAPAQPDGTGGQGKEQATLRLTESEVFSRVVKKQAGEGAGWGVLFGLPAGFNEKFAAVFDFPNEVRNHVTAGVVAFFLVLICKTLYGIFRGESATSDIIVVDRDGLVITRSDLWQTFTIKWSAVDQIALGVLSPSGALAKKSVRVWFREGGEPSREWLRKHRIPKQWPDGSYTLYKGDHEPHIPVERLHEALRTFAGSRYRDVANPPDPH